MQLIRAGVQEDTCEYSCQFGALEAFSLREGEPTAASRPLDKSRDGLAPSAGAGIVALEELDQARRRGTKTLAEIIGFALAGAGRCRFPETGHRPERESVPVIQWSVPYRENALSSRRKSLLTQLFEQLTRKFRSIPVP
jgi:hypothetical protein